MAKIRQIIFLLLLNNSMGLKMQEKFAWNLIDYNWETPEQQQRETEAGNFIPENNIILGIEKWKNKLFITVPRWRLGVASSLNYITLPNDEMSPKLNPYPSWDDNLLSNVVTASTVVSTYRVQADACDRLWVLDNGFENLLEKATQIVPSSVIIFDLNTDTLIRRYDIPLSQSKSDTFLPNIVVDSSKNNCENTFAYLVDAGSYGIIVYSFKENKSWRIEHNFFHMDPFVGGFRVSDTTFSWRDGVFGIAMGDSNENQSRNVYFHTLIGSKEFLVSNTILQNESYALGTDPVYDEFKIIGDRGVNGHSTTEVYDPSSKVIFFTQISKDGIGCWNINTPLNENTTPLIDHDPIKLVMPVDIKLDEDGYIWLISNRMPQYVLKQLNYEDYNYRVLSGRASELIKGTVCDVN